MFEAAKLMKNGVAHIKDLDMSLVKNKVSLNKQAGSCEVILIDIDQPGDIKVSKQTKPVNKDNLRFDFNDDELFNPDANSTQVAKKAYDWILNPVGFDYFKKEIKDKKIMIIQNRNGFTYRQDDPQDDIFDLGVFKQFVSAKNEFGQPEE